MSKSSKTPGNRSPYQELNVTPIEEYGPCHECGFPKSKILYGWHGVYYDLMCPRGHVWTYHFPRTDSIQLQKEPI